MTITRRALIGAALTLPAARLAGRIKADDISVLRRAYTAMHPGLQRYATPAQVSARFDALDAAFQRSDDLAARYLALSRFCGTVRCGHSYANFYNQTRMVQERLFSGRNRLPFRFRWIGGRMIVLDDGALPRGTEVLRIDGRPAAMILSTLLPLARADGGNDAKRRALLGVEGRDEWESFDIYFPLLFPAGDRFRLDVGPPGGPRRSLTVDAIDLSQRRTMRSQAAEREDRGWTLEHRKRTAIITMPDWGLYDSKWDWKGWIAAAMEEVAGRGSTGLIIDLRANEGGLDCGNEIVARLTDRTITEEKLSRRTRYRRAPVELEPYLDTWDKSFLDWGEDTVPAADGFYDLKRASELTSIAPQPPRFRGKIVVLTGPVNSSATFQFANLIRRERLGVLLGEPTGGNRRGINGGAFFFVRLPGGLEVDLPLIGYFPAGPQPDAGLVPDIAVAQTAADIAAGRDRALVEALALLG
jgi:C-terminal processing protease CtpA/Prc